VDSDILDAMRWAAGLHVTGVPDNTHPAQIINMSLEARAPARPRADGINRSGGCGCHVVIRRQRRWPGRFARPIAVGVAGSAGIRQIGTKVGFSSLGPAAALAAPAGNLCECHGSCLFSIDTTINNGTTTPTTSGYTDQMNPNLGTSFSARSLRYRGPDDECECNLKRCGSSSPA